MENDRRNFFKTVGAATAAAMVGSARTAEAAIRPDRYIPAYRYGLALDSVVDEIASFDGGNARGVVVSSLTDGGTYEKRISEVIGEDFNIALGANQSDPVYDWIRRMTLSNAIAKDGSIVAADAQGISRSQTDFSGAYITELTLPALDARSRDLAQILVKFTASSLQINRTPSRNIRFNRKAKAWQTSNFRLRIDGLDEACASVISIESLTFTQDVATDLSGQIIGVTPLVVPNLTLYCPDDRARQFIDWHYDFLINGNNRSANERFGSLEYLASDLKTVLFSLQLSGLGIFGCSLEGELSKTAARRIRKVEIYCEDMIFWVGRIIPS